MWITIIFIAAAAVGASSVTVVSQQQRYSEGKTYHDNSTVLLGGLLDISENEGNECGNLSTSAVEALEAMVFAIRSINEDNSILPNVNLTFDIRDTCSIANKALENSLSYVTVPAVSSSNSKEMLAVSGIIGAGVFSHVSMAVASLFRLFQVPQISYGSSASELSDRVRFDYFFRTLPSDSLLARAMADAVNHFEWPYIIALHSDDSFGREGLEIMLENIRAKENATKKCEAIKVPMPSVVSEEKYDDIVESLDQPWVRNASVALLYGYVRQAEGIMKAIKKRLEHNRPSPLRHITWIGCEALIVDDQYHSLVKGMVRMEYKVNMSHGFQSYFTTATPQSASSNPYFRTYWEKKFNCTIDMDDTNTHKGCRNNSLNGYTQTPDISSIIDAVYAFAHAVHGLIESHCSNHILCSDIMVHRSAGMAVNGTMIRDYFLYNLSFPGLSADMVQFDSAGNDQSSYVVKNLQRRSDGGSGYEYQSVGTWDPHNLLNITGDVEWNSDSGQMPESVCSLPCENGSFQDYVREYDCCWTCRECSGDNMYSTGEVCSECEEGYSPNEQRNDCILNPIYYLTWSNPWAIVIVIGTSLGLVLTALSAIIFLIFHKHKIIKASSRELSAILLVGLMLCYIQPFFFLIQPSIPICTIRRFLVGFCFAVCFSPLLVKTNRLHRIFNRSPEQLKTKPRFIGPFSQVLITFLLISVQVLIAIVWLAIEQPSTTYTYNSHTTELKCGASSDVSLIVSLAYNLLLLILSTYFAFLARKIPENFNEAKFINVTLYTIIIIWLALIPTYFGTVKLGSTYQTSSLVIAIIMSAYTTLCCLFAPKVFHLILQLRKKKETYSISNVFITKSSELPCTANYNRNN